jgi:hypothetical protein
MANTYTLIEGKTLTATAASVTFTTIPQTYTDLLLKFSCRSTSTAGTDVYANLKIQFNSDTGNNYNGIIAFGQGSGSGLSGSYTTQPGNLFSYANGNITTASTFSNGEVYIPNYTGSNQKISSVDCVVENNAVSGFVEFAAERWTGTSAITTIDVVSLYGLHTADSNFYLYGIKKN